MKIKLPDTILHILHILHIHQKEAFLVGGCVRDMLMNRPIHDYDIATNALPDETMDIFQKAGYKVLPTGKKYGTITVILQGEAIEITTYRIEQVYLHHRTPLDVHFTNNIKEDLKRRDFTMNAIAYHPSIGMIDPYHGNDDIQQQMICCVGDPKQRFEEDALRILRALRFQATLHFAIEKHTREAIRATAHNLTFISKERIRDEFTKILMGNMNYTLQTLHTYGVLSYILPGYETIYHHAQANPWHLYDVFTHTDIALNYTQGKSLACKLAIVFHDIGKPEKETFDENGIAHYKRHAEVSSKKALMYMRDLKFDMDMINRVQILILYHDFYITENKAVLRRYLTKFHNIIDFAVEGLDVQLADDMAKNLQLSQDKIHTIQRCIPILKNIASEETLPSLKNLCINGNDLMQLGMQGKTIGNALQDALQCIIDDPKNNQKDTILQFIKQKYKI